MRLWLYRHRRLPSKSMLVIHYYKRVKRLALFAVLVSLLWIDGCNSSHPPRIGSAAPDFTITDAQRTISLSQFRGKPVVLNFWASWCGPCIEETPALVGLQNEVGSQVTIIGISEDEDNNAYEQFVRQHNVDFMTIRDTNRTNELYGTFKFPETYIIDRNGKIVRKFIGTADWTAPDIVDYLKRL
jgi:cytochrome c biogenesis protein CcmG, thiol:disulfide interchange protein DsbE